MADLIINLKGTGKTIPVVEGSKILIERNKYFNKFIDKDIIVYGQYDLDGDVGTILTVGKQRYAITVFQLATITQQLEKAGYDYNCAAG